jgi:hypothetical protein
MYILYFNFFFFFTDNNYARNYKARLGFGNLNPELEEAKLRKKQEFNQALQEQIELNRMRKMEQKREEMMNDMEEEEKLKKQAIDEKYDFLAGNHKDRRAIDGSLLFI